MSYSRFCTNSCSGSMGKNGKKALATSTESTLPKLELIVMRIYQQTEASVLPTGLRSACSLAPGLGDQAGRTLVRESTITR
jgi:hypothetical protein